MSHDEVRMLADRIDHLTQAVSRLVTRITVIEHHAKPDAACARWIEERCVPRQEFDSLHRAEHDHDRQRLLRSARLADFVWKALAILALAAAGLQPFLN
ncbi:MAG: hypothetical protein K8R90_09425 [Candidatus Cloacimonetes bacterium]|nr:hypothetical protein [Candidatus Cloacimonadota bacterium]